MRKFRLNLRSGVKIGVACLIVCMMFTACDKSVTGVELEPSSATLEMGKTLTLTATILPKRAENKKVSWLSDNPLVATVENGVVKGVSVGKATITVVTEDGLKTATCTVTVTIGSGSNVINAQNVENGSSDIVSVKAATYNRYYVYRFLATEKYEKGGFILMLPDTIPDSYLYGPYWYDADEYGVDWFYFNHIFSEYVSDSEAKCGAINFLAYNTKENIIGEFYLADDDAHVVAVYIYVDRDCTLKVSDYDCTFKKGYNILYLLNPHSHSTEYTTQKPSGLKLKWKYEKY